LCGHKPRAGTVSRPKITLHRWFVRTQTTGGEYDECIEVTPNFIRMRKIILNEDDRKKAEKKVSVEA